MNRIKKRSHSMLAMSFAIVCLPAMGLQAAPRVHFDIATTVPCREVTPADFAEVHPHEMLVEAKFQVSSLIKHGSEDDLVQYFYRIESPYESLRVDHYLPKTELASDYAGNIGVEKKNEASQQIGVDVSIPQPYFPKAGGSAGASAKNGSTLRYDLLPPLELIAASGTIQRETGVYFKLKPSRRSTLEGGKEFVVVYRVPRSWRGDLVSLRCQAVGYDRGVVRKLDETRPSGTGDFLVALHLAGDLEAQQLANQYVRIERHLRRTAAQQRSTVRKLSYPSLRHKLGAYFSAVEPKIPTNWLERVIYSSPLSSANPFEERLPSTIQQEVQAYREAKLHLSRLNGLSFGKVRLSDAMQ